MTLNDGFDRTIAGWLDEQVGRGAPAYLDEVLAQTVRVRQRPWWSSFERWLPMETTLRFAPVPRMAWLVVVLALVLAVTGLAILIGSQTPPVNPFGPAGNGLMAFGTGSDIYGLDPRTGIAAPLITGPADDDAPLFSRDGSVFVFARSTAEARGSSQLILAKPDGSIVRTLTGNLPDSSIDWVDTIDWSPDGSRLAYIDGSRNAFLIIDVDGGPATALDLGMAAEDVRWRPNGQ